jgi:hypothetical protein
LTFFGFGFGPPAVAVVATDARAAAASRNVARRFVGTAYRV